jgi:hypothetical protein
MILLQTIQADYMLTPIKVPNRLIWTAQFKWSFFILSDLYTTIKRDYKIGNEQGDL